MLNNEFRKIVKDIAELKKIQGAENIAKAGAKGIFTILKHSKHKSSAELYKELAEGSRMLRNARPTEPCLRNTLNFIMHDLHHGDVNIMKNKLNDRLKQAAMHFDESKAKIVEYGSRLIKDGMVVFTHCHSSAVTGILINAKKQGKKFEVHNTETRPLFQGRITASELASHGIKVVHFVDSAARLALKKADLMLIGADAITSTGKVVNKIGSEMFAEIAKNMEVPVYVCTDAWKFDPETVFGYDTEIEKRYFKEVWPQKPKNVEIMNYAFEKVHPELIAGIISELGIFNCETFVYEVERAYKFLLEKE